MISRKYCRTLTNTLTYYGQCQVSGQTDGQTYVTRSLVLIVKLAVNIRPSQHNFGIPKHISEVWDFILYFYVFRWLVNQQILLLEYQNGLCWIVLKSLDVRTKYLSNGIYVFANDRGSSFSVGKGVDLSSLRIFLCYNSKLLVLDDEYLQTIM